MNMMGPGLDPATLARVVAHGKKIEAQMRRIQDRFEAIRGTAVRMKDAVPMEHGVLTWGETETYSHEGILAVEELARLMAVDPGTIMMGEENGGTDDVPK